MWREDLCFISRGDQGRHSGVGHIVKVIIGMVSDDGAGQAHIGGGFGIKDFVTFGEEIGKEDEGAGAGSGFPIHILVAIDKIAIKEVGLSIGVGSEMNAMGRAALESAVIEIGCGFVGVIGIIGGFFIIIGNQVRIIKEVAGAGACVLDTTASGGCVMDADVVEGDAEGGG